VSQESNPRRLACPSIPSGSCRSGIDRTLPGNVAGLLGLPLGDGRAPWRLVTQNRRSFWHALGKL